MFSLSHMDLTLLKLLPFQSPYFFISLKFRLWISVKRGTPGPLPFEVMKCLRCLFMMAPTSINYNVEVALSFWHLPWYQLNEEHLTSFCPSAKTPVDLYLNFEKSSRKNQVGKIKLENSSCTNWSFSLQKSISKYGYTAH